MSAELRQDRPGFRSLVENRRNARHDCLCRLHSMDLFKAPITTKSNRLLFSIQSPSPCHTALEKKHSPSVLYIKNHNAFVQHHLTNSSIGILFSILANDYLLGTTTSPQVLPSLSIACATHDKYSGLYTKSSIPGIQ